jgi:Uri superfamily endonuclease
MQKDCYGTYALVLKAEKPASVYVGKLGVMQVIPGYYVYTGSAFGPGGLRARVTRHLRNLDIHHWHIDYLRPLTQPAEVWTTSTSEVLEHAWAAALSTLPGVSLPIQGFGSSDCNCPSHLVYFSEKPSLEDLKTALQLTSYFPDHIQSWHPGDIQDNKFFLKRL